MKAAMQALGLDPARLGVVLVQIVSLTATASRCVWASARASS